jgi:hypothetical protein
MFSYLGSVQNINFIKIIDLNYINEYYKFLKKTKI